MTELDRIPDWMQPPAVAAHLDLKTWAQEFRDVYQIAEALCKTPFVPREMLGKQADVAAAIMKGRELGLDPFDALGSIYIVHGRVGFYAEFMRRRIIQAGHTLKIIENTDSRCVIEGTRKDSNEPQRTSFTAEQARKAGIDLGKYAADKLVARATSRLCRQVFPEVLSGSLIAEDLIDGLIPTDPVDPTELPPATPAPVQRTRKPRAAKAASTQPKPATTTKEPDPDVAELLDGEFGDEAEIRLAAAEAAADYAPPPDLAGSHAPTPGADPHDSNREKAPSDPASQTHDDVVDLTPQQLNTLPETLLDLAPNEPEPPATPAQNRKMHALFREHDLTEREDRLTITSEIIGYTINTSIGLTKSEANHVIDTLEAWIGDPTTEERIREILNTTTLTDAEQGLCNETE